MTSKRLFSVLFRVKGGEEIGSGHIRRCLVLAQALKKEGAFIHFLCEQSSQPFLEQAMNENLVSAFFMEDEAACKAYLSQVQVVYSLIVIDHYDLNCEDERFYQQFSRALLVLDDLADRTHHCDFLLDATIGRKKEDYDGLVNDTAQRLVGASYALLRPEFSELSLKSSQYREQLEKNIDPLRVLVCLGGTDPHNHSQLILEKLEQIIYAENLFNKIEVTLVLGLSNHPCYDYAQAKRSQFPFILSLEIATPKLAELMLAHHFSIGAGGTMILERACLSIPSLCLILADNQEFAAYEAQKIGLHLTVESRIGIRNQSDDRHLEESLEMLLFDAKKRQNLGALGRKHVDGQGASRLTLEVMRRLFS